MDNKRNYEDESTALLQTDEKRNFLCCMMKSSYIKECEIAFLMLGVIISGAFNRVSSKIMTQPMGNYSFFLSLFNSIVYVLLYFGILFVRYGLGIVTKDMLLFPWRRIPETDRDFSDPESHGIIQRLWGKIPPVKYFIIMGFMDGLGNILGIIATPYISGPMVSLMSQTIVLYSMLCAMILLRTRYSLWQSCAVAVVIAGAIVAIIPDITGAGSSENNLWYCLLMAMSTLPNAISFTLKEKVFKDCNQLQGKSTTGAPHGLDVFVVNSHGSLFQLLWWPVMVPITVLLNQTAGQPLGEYVWNGFSCFLGSTPQGTHPPDRCSPNPWPYCVYICINLVFNITLLVLLKRASALQSFMAVKAVLPVAVFLFYFKWPLIGKSQISNYIIISLFVIMIGLVLYRWTTLLKEKQSK